MPCPTKKNIRMYPKQRGPYQKHKPSLFPSVGKTTSVRGKTEYQKFYMRRQRKIERATR